MSTDGDKHEQYLKGVVWIEENHFMATDAENAKLKMYFFWENIENIRNIRTIGSFCSG